MSEHKVNPPGFDLRNAMSLDDVETQAVASYYRTRAHGQCDVWGLVITDDRKASMTTYRSLLNQAIGRGGIANYVSNVIDLEIHSGAASLIAEIY